MKWIWERARTILSVNFATMVEYRVELLFWMLATSLPLIMMGLWILAVRRGEFSMDETEVARYFLAAFLVRQFSIVWVIYEFEWYVVQGRLSPFLLQPLDPVWRFLGAHLSEQVARAPFVALMVVLFIVMYPASLSVSIDQPDLWWLPSWRAVLGAIVAIYAAFLTRFALQYTMAMASFWIEKPTSLENFLYIPYVYLSGIIAPLDLYPDAVRQIAIWTPFPYVVWFPATVLVEQNTIPFAQGVAVLLGWTLLFVVLNRFFWRVGLRRYSAMGA